MYGTLRGALAGRKIAFDPERFTATVEGRIAGPNKTTIRIMAIRVHYDLTIDPQDRAATERALHVHPAGCPVHESLRGAIPITWAATLHVGDETIALVGEEGSVATP
jgi:uncharacterized OsmC-like protein